MAGCNLPNYGDYLMLKERLATPKSKPFFGAKQPDGDFF